MRLIAQTLDRLGEGPCWHPGESRLYWFDIKGRRLHWFSPESGNSDTIELPMRASAAAPRSVGGLLMATESGLATFEPDSGAVKVVQAFALDPGFRTNDGKIDPQGRFWWSTMDDNDGERPGAVFVTTPDMQTKTMLEGVHIPNSVAMNADGTTFFLADSRKATLFACDAGDLSSREPFARTPQGIAPDGAAIDAEGYIWNAQWGGWRVVRYAPDGAIDRIVEAPVEQPTSVAFGGPGLATLYVTSAWDGLSATARAVQPQAGSLFAFEPGVAGLPLPLFAG